METKHIIAIIAITLLVALWIFERYRQRQRKRIERELYSHLQATAPLHTRQVMRIRTKRIAKAKAERKAINDAAKKRNKKLRKEQRKRQRDARKVARLS